MQHDILEGWNISFLFLPQLADVPLDAVEQNETGSKEQIRIHTGETSSQPH